MLAIICLVMTTAAHATHIVGGDFTYKSLGNGNFEVTLTIHRDCFNGADDAEFDTLATVAIYDGNGALAAFPPLNGYLQIPFAGADTINDIIISDCGFLGSQVCVHEAVYRDTLFLPDLGKGYILAYQRCCRNVTLNNIEDPLNTGMTEVIEIPQIAFDAINSSPVFNEWPDLYICSNQPFTFDHGATDPDGDELRYSLVAPYSGANANQPMPLGAPPPPYQTVDWLAPFGLNDLLGGTVPLTIDPATGMLSATPGAVGQYLVGVMVEEYRDGVKIGEVRRDFEYNVRICAEPPVAAFEPPTGLCDGSLTASFVNGSTAAGNVEWYFDWPNTDPAFYSTEENPTFTYPEPGTYTVKLKANRGTDECFDEFFYTFTTETQPVEAGFKAVVSECNDEGYILTVSDNSVPPSADQTITAWTYTLVQDGNTQTSSGQGVTNFVINPDGGDVSITLLATSSAGCQDETTRVIPISTILPFADFTTMVSACLENNHLELTFADISSANNAGIEAESWVWSISSSSGNATYTTQNVTANFQDDETITVNLEVTFDHGCVANISKEINLVDYQPEALFNVSASDCPSSSSIELTFADNSTDTDEGYIPQVYSWTVTSNAGTQTFDTETFTAVYDLDQTLQVSYTVSFTNGCQATIDREINVNDLLPAVDFSIVYTGCPDENINLLLTDQSAALNPGNDIVSQSWNITTVDGTSDYTGSTVELTTLTAQTITVMHTVTFANGCVTQLEREIDLLSLIPTANFAANYNGCPTEDNIQLTLTDTSTGGNPGNEATAWVWQVVSQEGTFDFTGNAIELGINPYQVITATLTTTFADGCTATVTRQVNVEDLLPAASFTYSYEGCPSTDPIVFTFTDTSNGADLGHPPVSWSWTVTSQEGSASFTGSSFQIELDPEQTITIVQEVEFANGCTDTNTQEVNLNNEILMPDFGAQIQSCNDASNITVTLTDMSHNDMSVNPPSAWAWTVVSNGATQNLTGEVVNLDLMSDQSADITLEVTYENGCVLQTTKTIDLSELLPSTSIGFDTNGCTTPDMIDVILSDLSGAAGNSSEAIAWNWSVTTNNGVLNYSDAQVNVSLDPYQEIIVELEVAFADGCSATAKDTFNLEEQLPQVQFTTALSNCEDASTSNFTLTDISASIPDNASTPVSQVWSVTLASSGTTLNGSGETFDFAADPNDTATISMSTTFENGCTVTATKEVSLAELMPMAGYTFVPELCNDEATIDLVFTDASTTPNGETVTDVSWMIGNSSMVQMYTGTPVTVTVVKGQEVLVTQVVTFSNGCIDTLMNSFTPDPAAAITFTGNPLVACADSQTPIVVDGNPDWTYTWSPTEGLDFSGGTHNPVFVGTTEQVYYVTVTDGLCTVEDSISIQVGSDTELVLTGDMFSCTGMVDLTVSGGVGLGEYEWVLASDPSNVIFTGENLVTTFEGASETYIVSYSNEDCPGMPLEVTIGAQYPNIDLLEPYQICRGDSVALQVFNNDPTQMLTYVWEENPHITGGNNTDTPIIEVGENETDPFGLPFTVTNQYGCVLYDTLNVIIVDMPVLSFSNTLTNCNELEMCFEVTADIFGFAVWDFGDPNTTDDTALGEMVCYTYPDFGTYTVTLSNISGVCQAEPVSMEVTLYPQIEIATTNDTLVCQGQDVTLTAETNLPEFSAIWCNMAGDTLATSIDYTHNTQTDDMIVLKVMDPNGCTDMDTIKVNTFDFSIDVQFPDVFCGMQEIPITVINNSDGDLTYQWGPEDCIVSGADTATPVLTATGDSKTFSVTVTDVALGCTQEFSYEIPISDFSINADADPDAEIYLGEEVDIYVVDAMDDYTYMWDNGNTESTQTVSPEETTTYTVTVTDENGCTDTAQVTITVQQPQCDETDVYIPNAFSPNGDGTNDVLYVRSNYIESMFLIIYDRWGEEVFRSTDQNIGWDGTFEGEELAPDAYAYILDVVCVNAVNYKRKGNVSIIR